MATKYWDLRLEREITSIEDSLFFNSKNKKIQLKRVDNNGKFAPDGTFPNTGIVQFRNWRADAIDSLFSFESEEEHKLDTYDEKETEIKFQISEDCGVTWKYWSGSEWITATTDEHWNTSIVIDENINSFLFSGIRQIAVRAKLYPSADNKYTPVLKTSVALHHELSSNFNWVEDAKRTLKHFIENNLTFPLYYRVQLSGSTDTFEIQTDFEVASVEAIYNLTDDQNKINNLYQSHVDRQVTMSSSQDENDIIEVQFSGKAPVFLGADVDSNISSLPCIVISNSDAAINTTLKDGSRKLEHKRSTYEVKVGQKPIWKEMTTEISCKTARDLPTISMAKNVFNLFNSREYEIISEGCGHPFNIIDLVPYTNRDDLAVGLHRKDVTFVLSGLYWVGTSVTKKAVERVVVGIGDTVNKLESVND